MAQDALHVVEEEHPQDDGSKTPKGARPTKPLPTDRITFDKQLGLLRTYASVYQQGGKPVTNAQVGDIVHMKASTVSLANAFFVDARLLQRAPDNQGFIPAAEVIAFLGARNWNPDTAGHKLAPIISDTWFAKAIMTRLALDPIDEEKALQVLAEAVGNVSIEYKVNLRALISYMEVAGLVQRDGTIIKASRIGGSVTVASDGTQPADAKTPIEIPTPPRATVATTFLAPAEGLVQFNVNVKVDMAEFAGWPSDRIAAFFAGIAQVLAAKAGIEKGASQG